MVKLTLAFIRFLLLELRDSLVDGVCDEVHVGRCETAHADAAVAQQVNVLLLQEVFAHFRRKTGERKHADLENQISISMFAISLSCVTSRRWYKYTLTTLSTVIIICKINHFFKDMKSQRPVELSIVNFILVIYYKRSNTFTPGL